MAEPNFREIGLGIGEAITGPKLTSNEKFKDFLAETEFHNDRFEKKMVKEQSYYALMTQQERTEHLAHIEFANMANFKKTTPSAIPNLETLANGPEIKGLSTPENATIYNVPGVKTAIELYVRFYEHDTVLGQRDVRDPNKADITLKNSQGRLELSQCRGKIRSMIKNDVKNGNARRGQTNLNEDDLELKTRLAEQMAFTFLNAGNYFEGSDSEWTEQGRVRESGCYNEDVLNVAIKIAMNPLDQIVGTLKKSYRDLKPYGRLGLWAWKQATNHGRKPLTEIKEVVLIQNENESKKDFWRVDNGGSRLYAPKCYVTETVGSVFKETKVDERTLLDFIRKGEEIPWERVPGNMWSDYSSKLSKAQILVDFYQGKNPLKLGDQNLVGEWTEKVDNTLGNFGLRAADQIKRWIFMSTVGIDPDFREPRILQQNEKMAYIIAMNTANFIQNNNYLFPWDKRKLWD